MSKVFVEVVTVDALVPHPNADRLEIAKVLGTQVCVQKGSYKVGDLAIYFPPDMILPEVQSAELGVQQYLKEIGGVRCRVGAARLRGVPSYGFLAKVPDLFIVQVGDDVSIHYDAVKYEPPVKVARDGGVHAPCPFHLPEVPNFHRYTDIQHYYRYAKALEPGTPVRITEKIHGANCRVGLIKIDGEFDFVAGSHRKRLKHPGTERQCAYWAAIDTPGVMELLSALCDEQHDVVIYGEIFGPGVQDMDYGQEGRAFRVFDISIDGRYIDADHLKEACDLFGVEMVPVLYEGPWNPELLEDLTHGTSVVGPHRGKFKGREGVVITPLTETYSDYLGGRLVLKSVSADYLDRKGAQDNGELQEAA